MGLLVNGKWIDKWYDTKSVGGKFVRQTSTFRNIIGSDTFPAEKKRYHLYVSYACPWAHRTIIFRRLKNLESVISLSAVEPLMLENGWVFRDDGDTVNHKKYLHEIYTLADPSYSGRVTVPVLWDTKTCTIVNNESSEIIRMLNHGFHQHNDNTLDFYPADARVKIDAINDFIYETINNGVYKAGFATSQDIYEKEVNTLFAALDTLEARLNQRRYLLGDRITEADWRLFTTLVRFDPVYVGHFKCNVRRLADYKNLSGYVRELYQVPGVRETVNMRHIKAHYYGSHKTINPTAIVPAGPEVNFDVPSNRDRLSKQ